MLGARGLLVNTQGPLEKWLGISVRSALEVKARQQREARSGTRMVCAEGLLFHIQNAPSVPHRIGVIVGPTIKVNKTIEAGQDICRVRSENLFADFEKPLRQRDGLVVFVLGGELGNASLQFFNLARLWRGGAPTRGER